MHLGSFSKPGYSVGVGTMLSTSSDNGMAIEEISRLVGHSSTNVTETVYRNSRELHQPGEKPQVARSAPGGSRHRSDVAAAS
jgi:integrase